MIEQSQENCQKQINDLLNKIKISQEEHEIDIRRDMKNLNMNESGMSGLLKEGFSSALKFECERDMDSVNYYIKI